MGIVSAEYADSIIYFAAVPVTYPDIQHYTPREAYRREGLRSVPRWLRRKRGTPQPAVAARREKNLYS